jgi:hypothetical protein
MPSQQWIKMTLDLWLTMILAAASENIESGGR